MMETLKMEMVALTPVLLKMAMYALQETHSPKVFALYLAMALETFLKCVMMATNYKAMVVINAVKKRQASLVQEAA